MKRAARRASAGFSLVELLIALTIGLVVLTVLGTVFARTASGRGDLERVTRLLENSRYAADIVGEDVRHAGFYGTFMPPSDTIFVDASPCGWNTADVTQMGWQPTTTSPRYPAQLQGWDDPGATVPELDCLPNRLAGTDVLAIRRVSSQTVTAAQVAATNVYVQASQCISDPVLLRVSNTATQFTLRTASCVNTSVAAIRRYFVRVYYVASCNECTPSDGVPTLKRMEVIDNVYRVVSLAEGVADLQFQYAFDTDGDAVPDQMLTATTSAGATASWGNVVAVRMHLLMRSSEPGMSADTTSTVFDMGPGHTAETCPDRYKCRLLTTTFRLNNIAGRRES